jgi:hypothetical protein
MVIMDKISIKNLAPLLMILRAKNHIYIKPHFDYAIIRRSFYIAFSIMRRYHIEK